MWFEVSRAVLVDLTRYLDLVIPNPKKIVNSFLAMIYLGTKKGVLTLQASDGSMSLELSTKAVKIYQDTEILIPADLFIDLVKTFPDGDLLFSIERNCKSVISSERMRIELQGAEADNFPRPELSNLVDVVSLDSTILRTAINHTFFACFPKSENPISGVLMRKKDGFFEVVATDGHRLALIRTESEAEFEDLIVPKETMEILRKLLGRLEIQVHVKKNDNIVVFEGESFRIISPMLFGRFPSLERVLNENFFSKIKLQKDSIVNTLEMISSLEERYVVPARFVYDGETLVLASAPTERGSVFQTLTPDELSLEAGFKISFNPIYLLEALKAIGASQVEISFTTPTGPIQIKPTSYDYTYIMMPVRE